MKRGSTLFLKLAVLFIAVISFAGLFYFPQTEGRAKDLNLAETYMDPFIIYVYLASIPFFFGLFQAFRLLNLIDANKAFSQEAVNVLKKMKYASLSMIGFILVALVFIRFFANGDDSAGPTMLGFIVSLIFGIIATSLAVFQRLFQNAVDIKSENDLTV